MKFVDVDGGYKTPCKRPVKRNGEFVSLTPDGYSKSNKRGVNQRAHRAAYEEHHGILPELLDHLCRNRWCCNVFHLEPVPTRVNNRRGEQAKLTDLEAACIKVLCAEGVRHDEIAYDFGISKTHVGAIAKGKYWCDGPCKAWEQVKERRHV